MSVDKKKVLNSLTLLAIAYGFAKDGQAETAGELFVQAAEDGALDSVMDGVAQGSEALEAEEDGDYEDIPEEEDEEVTEELDASSKFTQLQARVQIPESVARLASRTLV